MAKAAQTASNTNTRLRHFGFQLPFFRSSDLWDDPAHASVSKDMKLFDLEYLSGAGAMRVDLSNHMQRC